MLLVDHDVEILVWTRWLTEQRVHCPTTVDPGFDTRLHKPDVYIQSVVTVYFHCSVFLEALAHAYHIIHRISNGPIELSHVSVGASDL